MQVEAERKIQEGLGSGCSTTTNNLLEKKLISGEEEKA